MSQVINPTFVYRPETITATDVRNWWNTTQRTNEVLDEIIDRKIVIDGYTLSVIAYGGQEYAFVATKDGEPTITFESFGQLPPEVPGVIRSALKRFLDNILNTTSGGRRKRTLRRASKSKKRRSAARSKKRRAKSGKRKNTRRHKRR
jgi:hypothetical protein